MKNFILLFALFLFSYCGLKSPRFKAEKHFPGLNNYGTKTYCILFHGMGSKDQNYSYNMINNLAKNKFKNPCIRKEPNFSDSPSIEKFVASNQDNNETIIFYSIRWSNLTDPLKESLMNEENKNPRRRKISKIAKNGLMIDLIKDVMAVQEEPVLDEVIKYLDTVMDDIYLSTPSNPNINIISASLGSAMIYRYLQIKSFNTQVSRILAKEFLETRISNTKILNPDDKTQATEKDLIPSFNPIYLGPWSSVKPLPYDKQKLINQDPLEITSVHFYMLTNQINLMGKSINNWGGVHLDKSSLDQLDLNAFYFDKCPLKELVLEKFELSKVVGSKGFVESTLNNPTVEDLKPAGLDLKVIDIKKVEDQIKKSLEKSLFDLNIVAFRNPNDLLCYYLPDNAISDISLYHDSLKITNVYYFNFLRGNNIVTSHTLPFDLKKMANVITKGSDKNRRVKIKSPRQKKCCTC